MIKGSKYLPAICLQIYRMQCSIAEKNGRLIALRSLDLKIITIIMMVKMGV
jgi:hypothetical protein